MSLRARVLIALVTDGYPMIQRGKLAALGTTAELKSDRALEDVFLELTYGND